MAVTKTDTETHKESEAPEAEVRKYFLPETGQVVEAANAADAAAKRVDENEKVNEG